MTLRVTYSPNSNGAVQPNIASGSSGAALGEPRTIHPVCKVDTRQEPVVRRVFEYVAEGHGAVRETMDKDSFQLTLQKVGHDKIKCPSLHRRVLEGCTIERLRQVVKCRMDEQRAAVFNEEYRAPSNLRT